MDQNLDRTGEPSGDLSTQTGATWTEQALSGAGYRGLALVLRRSGSLVLVTPAGQVLWSTHTSNGRARTVVLRDNGRLVLLDGSGNRVWASNSGIYALGGGDRVGPGEQLIGTINYFSGRGATLRNTSKSSTGTMQRDGDFVYRCSRDPRIVWHTNTHRAGSYMEMSQTGNLVIRGPLGRVLWSSHTAAWHHVFSSLGISVHNAQGDNWYAFNYPVGSSC